VKKAYIRTFGCQMNEHDSRQMLSLLAELGYEKTQEVTEADIIVLNTCSIRAKAEHKIYSELGRLRPLKKTNPQLIICVAGCVAQQEKQKLSKRFPLIDIILGPDQIGTLPSLVQQRLLSSSEQEHCVLCHTNLKEDGDYSFLNVLPSAGDVPVKSFVNIQKGCDNFCAYCIVPYVRGRESSRPPQDIIDEINKLTERGVKEVTLLGQNVNSYGLKEKLGISFPALLEAIARQTSLKRLRFATSHPKDVSDELIAQFAVNPILAPQFHLPLQSGSDRILKLMNRHYSQEQYLGLVAKLKKAVPHINFSTDLIVGFPSETDDDLQQTLEVMRQVGYTQTYSFVYSPRPHTTAAHLPDDVPLQEKAQRLKTLQELDREVVSQLNQKDVGTVQSVLMEECRGQEPHPYLGRTPGHKVIHFSTTKKISPGNFVDVRVTRANPHCLFGETV